MSVPPFAHAGDLVGVSSDVTAHDKRLALREALAGGTLVLPGATDAMGARLVERAGFGAGYLTGAGLANVTYGLPDIGLVSLAEVAAHVDRVASAVRIPLVVDADTGYGAAVSVMRTVQMLERAGAAGIQLEDQEMPKRCGHFDSHALIPGEHMAAKIVAARQARQDEATVIVARTDARSVHDIDEAIRRAQLYVEAGADVLFVEAPRTVDELERVGRELAGTPLLVNVVEGGKTPELSLEEYERLGFTVVLFANYLMRSMMLAGREALEHLATAGETGSRVDRMASWQERQELFNLPRFSEAEAWFDSLGSAG
ncbi:isocitrate lyase/PEP mutase family protein [Janibacter anophelis]|uniref:isocitrate lyase/PEP mutase family protein n=1 Tax=Janibacter anophelis TaxID=319054 RepID=UPI003F7CD65B